MNARTAHHRSGSGWREQLRDFVLIGFVLLPFAGAIACFSFGVSR